MPEIAYKPQVIPSDAMIVENAKEPFFISGHSDAMKLPDDTDRYVVITNIIVTNNNAVNALPFEVFSARDTLKRYSIMVAPERSFAVDFLTPMIFYPFEGISFNIGGVGDASPVTFVGFYTKKFPNF